MLNLNNIDMNKKYRTVEDEVRATKTYIYQLVQELEFRLKQDNQYAEAEGGSQPDSAPSTEDNVFDRVYPVGSIYMSVNSTDPQELFGGTWERIAEGRTLFGAGTLDEITYTAGETKDAGLPNLSGNVVRALSDYNLNNSNYSQHTTAPFYYNEAETYGTTWNATEGTSDSIRNIKFDASRANSIYGNSDTVQPPALVVYMWKRTA